MNISELILELRNAISVLGDVQVRIMDYETKDSRNPTLYGPGGGYDISEGSLYI